MMIPKSWDSQQARDYLRAVNAGGVAATIAFCDWGGCPGITSATRMTPADWDATVQYHEMCLLGGVMNAPEWSD